MAARLDREGFRFRFRLQDCDTSVATKARREGIGEARREGMGEARREGKGER